MYQSELPPIAGPRIRWRPSAFWPPVAPTVWYLGLTSLLTDLSSEMVASVLPLYLVVQLNLSPLAFGALDGLYNGMTAVTRWAGGLAGDRWRRHKAVAAAGYAVSAVCKLGLVAAGRDVSALAAVIASDRLGKGIRTVPRDALISLSASGQRLGQSFGVHRALDATGAMLGPLAAFALLALVPGRFDVVFVTSFCVAVVGLGVLVLFVENIATVRHADADGRQGSIRAAVSLLRQPDFRRVVTAASGLALVTVSDAFIYLVLRERVQFGAHLFPLLYVGTAAFYLALAIPAGWLADRWGRSRVFIMGHGMLLVLYVVLLSAPGGALGPWLAVALLGAYYAATDGVSVALASGMLPAGLRGSGLAVLTTATSLSRLVASIVFGWMWTIEGTEVAVASFGLALIVGIAFARIVLGRPVEASLSA